MSEDADDRAAANGCDDKSEPSTSGIDVVMEPVELQLCEVRIAEK